MAAEEWGYDAFISYSHRLDSAVAARLQSELQHFARPWYQVRALRVFRDQTSLAASPNLWTTIEQALASSRWLILMASPESAQSPWVAREIGWWREHRPVSHVLIAVTSGELVWDAAAGDLDWAATTALSKEALGHAFGQEPRWVDVRWTRPQESSLRPADPRFQDAVADLAAAIRQVPKDSLIGEHIRQRRRTVRALVAGLAALVILLAVAVSAAFIASGQRNRAIREETVATAGQLASTAISLTGSHPDLAQLFAAKAYQLDPADPQTRAALFATVQSDPQVQRFLQASGPVAALTTAADGRFIVAGTTTGWVQRWTLPGFQRVTVGRLAGPVSGVAVSADGSVIAAADGHLAQVWGPGGPARPHLAPPGHRFTAVGLSPSGRFAAFAAYPSLAVLDTTSGTWSQRQLSGFTPPARGRPATVTGIAMPSESGLVTFNGYYGSWQRFTLPGLTPAGSAHNVFGLGRFPAYAYALSPAGTLATYSGVAAGRALRVWSTARPGARAGRARLGGRLALALAISRDDRWVASEDAGGIHVSRISSTGPGHPATSYPGAEPIFVTSLAFLGGSDTRLVSASGNLVTLWNLGQYSRIGNAARIRMPWRCGQVCPGPRLAIRPGSQEAVITDSNGDLLQRAGLGAAFGKITRLATGSTQQYGLPQWSPSGRQLYLYGAKAYTITMPGSDAAFAGQPLTGRAVTARADPDPPQYVTVLGDGTRLARIDADGRIRVGSGGPGQRGGVIRAPATLHPNPGLYQHQAAVSPGGTRAAIIDQVTRQVYVINLSTGLSWLLPGLRAYQLGYAGTWLVIQRENGDVDVRATDGTRLIRSIQAGTPWNYGNFALSGRASGDPGLVAEERANGQGVVADLGTGQVLGVFPVGKASPYQQTTMAFTPGGRSLVTVTEGNNSSPDGLLTQLSLIPAQWARVACTTSGHSLTAQDWRRYISGTPPAQLGCAG
ncbi:MAG TPA: toll/interleukin-1 receptor domain-containing protein [Streptosporangiaceae bacterium]|nr:toll/interleukin-1 receptor domain-containing protein [Streptosporangiaceae bacterium]